MILYLPRRSTARAFGISVSTLERRVAEGRFPRPRPIVPDAHTGADPAHRPGRGLLERDVLEDPERHPAPHPAAPAHAVGDGERRPPVAQHPHHEPGDRVVAELPPRLAHSQPPQEAVRHPDDSHGAGERIETPTERTENR